MLDASAVVELVLGLEHGREIADRIANPAESLHAPHLLTAEVAQVIRRFESRQRIDADRGAAAITDTTDLDITYYDHVPLLPRVWTLRRNATAYDALYLSLAEALDAPLLTGDSALQAVPGHGALIEVFGSD